jgi:hypothetical protein
MPDALTVGVATAVVTAFLSGLTTYYGTKSKIRHDLLAQYDKDLRDRRLAAYSALWALTEPLARYSPPKPLSGLGARQLSERLRGWYFRDGIVLSKDARTAYFDLQKMLTEGPVAAAAESTKPFEGETLKALRGASSDLHTALCDDVGSRKPPMIGKASRTDEKEEAERSPGQANSTKSQRLP